MFHLRSRSLQRGMLALAAAVCFAAVPAIAGARTVAGEISGRVTDTAARAAPDRRRLRQDPDGRAARADAEHLVMPRLSFEYYVTPSTVIRGGGDCSTTSPKATWSSRSSTFPILDNVTFENANISNPTAGSLSAIGALGDINAIDPDLTLPQQTQEYARSAADPEAHPSTQS